MSEPFPDVTAADADGYADGGFGGTNADAETPDGEQEVGDDVADGVGDDADRAGEDVGDDADGAGEDVGDNAAAGSADDIGGFVVVH